MEYSRGSRRTGRVAEGEAETSVDGYLETSLAEPRLQMVGRMMHVGLELRNGLLERVCADNRMGELQGTKFDFLKLDTEPQPRSVSGGSSSSDEAKGQRSSSGGHRCSTSASGQT